MLLTIDSSVRILDLFDAGTPEWGVTEVAEALSISKSKAHSLMSSLCDVGLLRRTPRNRYRLGWRLLGLGRVLSATTDFHQQARPVMVALCARLEETIHLGTLDNGGVVYVDRVQSPRGAEIPVSAIGSSMPAHCTGIGKMLLSYMGERELDAMVAERGLQRRTESTIVDLDELRNELARASVRGAAFDLEEAVPGLSCVSAPIMGIDGYAVAAISISAPSVRFEARREMYEAAVVRAGKYVSRKIRSELGAALAA